MKKKLVVGILYGGKSVEHEVSVRSAKNVAATLDRTKYNPVLIPISREGKWASEHPSHPFLPSKLDVVFPVLHGTNGEDGTVQGFLKLADVPFVGPGVLASAVGMDKDVTKRLWREAGLPVGKFLVFQAGDKPDYRKISHLLGGTVFVKPATLGSSVGISKAKNEREFQKAVRLAFRYDTKILIEEFIPGREIEVAVLGNTAVRASIPGEIRPRHDFYSYEAKYLDENGAELIIPAALTPQQGKAIREIAIKAFKTIGCEGMARVDFFMRTSGNKIFLNEINTIPGFTNISMYPKLWETSGITYTKLIDTLIQLALKRYAQEKKLKTSRV